MPFTRNNLLLPDKQKIPTPVRKNAVAEPVTSKVPYVTNVKVEYPSPKPVSVPSNEHNIVRLKISEETGGTGNSIKLDSDVVLHRSPKWTGPTRQGPEQPADTDERDENAKSVYNDVIRALKKTRSPMYAELNEQSTPVERTQSLYGAKETQGAPKIQRQVSKSKKKRPERVSQGNTPADVRLALAALNTVIDGEIEKGADPGTETSILLRHLTLLTVGCSLFLQRILPQTIEHTNIWITNN